MTIKSETFYRAECEKCPATLPNDDDHEASAWPLDYVEKHLREPFEHRGVMVAWFYEEGRTLCPEHHPDAKPCGAACDAGNVQVDGPPPNWPADREWSLPHHWADCPECHGVGFHPAPVPVARCGRHDVHTDHIFTEDGWVHTRCDGVPKLPVHANGGRDAG